MERRRRGRIHLAEHAPRHQAKASTSRAINGLPKPFAGGGGNEDATKGIIASWAVGVAMQVADVTAPNYDQQVMQYARMALEARRQMKNEVEP